MKLIIVNKITVPNKPSIISEKLKDFPEQAINADSINVNKYLPDLSFDLSINWLYVSY